MKRTLLILGMLGLLVGCDDGGLGAPGVDADLFIIGTDTTFSDVASTYGSVQRLVSVSAVAPDATMWRIAVSATGSTNGPAKCQLSVFLDGVIVPNAGTFTDVAAAGLWQSDYTADVRVVAGEHMLGLYLISDMGGYTCSVHAFTEPSMESARVSITARTP